MTELAKAEAEIDRRNAEEAEKEKRTVVTARAKFSTAKVNPFDVFDVEPERERGWHKGRPITEGQRSCLEKAKIDVSGLSFTHASQMISEMIQRRKDGKCSYGQARILKKNNRSTNCSFQEASSIIDGIATAQGWDKKRR